MYALAIGQIPPVGQRDTAASGAVSHGDSSRIWDQGLCQEEVFPRTACFSRVANGIYSHSGVAGKSSFNVA